jgi:hypothetical protein
MLLRDGHHAEPRALEELDLGEVGLAADVVERDRDLERRDRLDLDDAPIWGRRTPPA